MVNKDTIPTMLVVYSAKHGAIQRILKMCLAGRLLPEMAAARAAFRIMDHTALSGKSIFLCPGCKRCG